MNRASHPGGSLARRLLWVLFLTLTVLALGLWMGGAYLIHRVVERSFDSLLAASAQEIAETIAPQREEVTFDIPPSALGMLENAQGDSVYYSVRRGERLLTGYAELPRIDISHLAPEMTTFRYATFRGKPIRIATIGRQLPRISDLVVVEVAQTTGERQDLAMLMLVTLAILEFLLVVCAGLFAWPALRWSLRPVNRIKDELETRPATPANFTPLGLQHVPNELTSLVSGFNRLLLRLEESVDSMRRFTSDASHQMRTPLTVIKTHLALLSRQVPGAHAATQSIADIEDALTRLDLILAHLITLARADDIAREGFAAMPINLRDIITSVISDLVPLASERNIALAVESKECSAWATADPVIAAEILTNLLDNAIRYNRPAGNVHALIATHPECISVTIEDDGPGIPPSEQQRVFERFYRLPRDQVQLGSGLGLPIVKTLADAIHAQVSVGQGIGGRGLGITVRFRRASPVKQASASVRTARRLGRITQHDDSHSMTCNTE